MDFARINARLLSQAAGLLAAWLPHGRLRGREFVVGGLDGAAGDSLSVNIDTGRWSDFAVPGCAGGDLISLYAAIHRIPQGEAAKRLDEAPRAVSGPARPKREVIAPAPLDAPPCACTHYKHGPPSHVWDYRDADGQLLGHVARYDTPHGKEIVPWTWAGGRWGMGSWAAPRPLYGLDDLALRPDAPVLVVEGEKAADAVRTLAQAYVVVTWPGGSSAHAKADWKPLAGRRVLLWPDADEPGIRCMWQIGARLIRDCPEVRIILPEGQPDKWDAADAVAAGWDWAAVRSWAQPRVVVVTEEGAAAGAPPPTPPVAASAVESPPETARPAIAAAEPVTGGSQVSRWLSWGLDRNGNGLPLANLNNAVRVLECDPQLRGQVWFDRFQNRILTPSGNGCGPRPWSDADDINLTLYLQRTVGVTKISREIVAQSVIQAAYQDVRHCVQDWLESLAWDGEPRIDCFFEDHFGVPGTVYTRAAGRNFWISLAARALRPGCKVDNMIVLEGAQAAKKSTALRVIGGEWFTEQHESVTGKGFFETLQGKLVVEISEMDAFSRGDITRVKQVVSCQSDRYREPYGRHAIDHPRQCVFVGSTNRDDWNRDETGARRFWPIRCGEIDIEGIAAAREQLFAEAVHRFRQNETWWEMPEAETRQEQAERYDADPWMEPVADYLAMRSEITVYELLTKCLKFDESRIGRPDQMRAASCLRVLGWVKAKQGWTGSRHRVWERAGSSHETL